MVKSKVKKSVKFSAETNALHADVNDLSAFNTKTKKLINDNGEQMENGDSLMKNLFVTQDTNEVVK